MKNLLIIPYAACLLFFAVELVSAQTDEEKLSAAIHTLRNVDSEALSQEQKMAKAEEIEKAWKLIVGYGQQGVSRLKEEVKKIDAENKHDEFFKLNSTVLLWQIGKKAEVEDIAKIWSTTRLSAQYTYVFMTAFEAAITQDPKVLPLLRTILKDDKGSMYVPLHAMTVNWPLSHEFIWGSYGPTGLNVLADILENSKDEVEIKSAIKLLAQSHYLPALPKIRQFAKSENDGIRHIAIQSIGNFGHPDDYDLLIAGLNSENKEELFHYTYALYEFGDTRAVPHIIPLMEKGDTNLTAESFVTLLHLLTPESFDATNNFFPKVADPMLREVLGTRLEIIKQLLPANFNNMPKAKKAAILNEIRNRHVTLDAEKAGITNQELIAMAKAWKEKGRMSGNSGNTRYSVAQMINAARSEDINVLLEAKAAFYKRLSDECLYEVRDIDTTIKYIGRSRYRKDIGVSDKAEKH